mmetsp:Transcript_40391/g.91977  ORF Transcript_40391/g.91977 Transcript_40391/m.91977 type:complete len:81 (-) Transcript_40391:27-269(-)
MRNPSAPSKNAPWMSRITATPRLLRRSKVEEPHMYAIMKLANTMPKAGVEYALLRAGVQWKTKVYIEPSKQATMTMITIS